MLTVSEDELHFADEYDSLHEVYYQSEPFTGIAKTASGTTGYRNGSAHGPYEIRFADGSPSEMGTYVDGECIAMQSWYENGRLRHTYQDERTETRKWDRDGVLAYWGREDENGVFGDRWYYKSGVVRAYYTSGQGTDYFASDSRLAMRVT